MVNKKTESFPTQQFIEIESIKDDAITVKNGGLRRVLLISGTNFTLKSEEEQGIIIYAFQGFLNSIDFTLQIFIHSRKLNISDYLTKLENLEIEEKNELLRNQISEYREFIRSFVEQNAIMQKRFFAVVPYDPIQIPGAGANAGEKIFNWFRKSKSGQNSPEEKSREILAENLAQLDQRVDQVINGLNQMGLRAVPLNNDELLELFYNLYNPTTVEKRTMDIEDAGEQKNAK